MNTVTYSKIFLLVSVVFIFEYVNACNVFKILRQ